MAGEIQFSYLHGIQAYVIIRNSNAQAWNATNSAFQAYSSANYSQYVIQVTEQGIDSSYFVGNFPSAIPAGVYSLVAKQMIGITPAETDPTISTGDVQWNGSIVVALANLVSSGQIGKVEIQRGEMVPNFYFKLVSSLDHVTPFTSGTCSGQISRDGGNFGPLESGAFTEKGLGWYCLQALTSGDLDANTLALWFQGMGMSGGLSDPREYSIVLQGGTDL